MKKIISILTVISVLVVAGVAVAQGTIMTRQAVLPSGQMVIVPEQAADNSPAIGSSNDANLPPGLEKIEFIHYKKGFGKSEEAKAAKTNTCYKFLTPRKVKWTSTPVEYVINPAGPVDKLLLTEAETKDAIFNGAGEWDDWTSKDLMDKNPAFDPEAVYGVYDHKNAIVFGNYPSSGVIAVTSVWYNTFTRAIVEFDMMFDTDWTWGDADPNNDQAVDNSNVMDLQNIATHEFGHAIGLGDVYSTVCSQVTMYGYSNYGEIIKRTLEAADITGLRTLYGN